MFTSPRFLLPLLALLSVSACKSNEDPVQELCETVLSCSCTTPPYATAEACVTGLNKEAEDLKTLASANGLVFDQDCFDRGLDLLRDFECSPTFTGSTSECSYCMPVHGDKAAGAACGTFGESEEYDDCAAGLACTGGVCADPCAQVDIGAECATLQDGSVMSTGSCVDGAYCDFSGSLTCKPLQDIGGDCMPFIGCKEGLECDANNKCAAAPGEGDACTFLCAEGLGCVDNVCVAPPGEGEPCAMNTNTCAEGLECDDNQVCSPAQPLLCWALAPN